MYNFAIIVLDVKRGGNMSIFQSKIKIRVGWNDEWGERFNKLFKLGLSDIKTYFDKPLMQRSLEDKAVIAALIDFAQTGNSGFKDTASGQRKKLRSIHKNLDAINKRQEKRVEASIERLRETEPRLADILDKY